MSLFEKFFGKKDVSSATQAKERLQLIIAHERRDGSHPDFLPALKQELMAVLAKYLDLKGEAPTVSFESDNTTDLLKIDIVIPQK